MLFFVKIADPTREIYCKTKKTAFITMKRRFIPHACGAKQSIFNSIVRKKQGTKRRNRIGMIPKLVVPIFLKTAPKAIKDDNKKEMIKATNPIINVTSK